VAQDRANFEEALNRGHSYSWDQRWQEAIAAFDAAVSLASKEPAPYAGLGMAYLELEQLDKALENYKKAARFSRGNVIYLRKVADVQEQLGQLSDAGKTYMAIGEMALSKRRLNEAMDNWHRAVRLEPKLLRAHQRLASVYQRQGAIRNAVQEYLAIAQILQEQGDDQKALEACQLALQLDPRNKDILTAVELIRQGEAIFGGRTPAPLPVSSSRGTTGLLQRMAEAGDPGQGMWQADRQITETAVPVRDARRMAMEQLAAGLFADEGDDGDTDIGKPGAGLPTSRTGKRGNRQLRKGYCLWRE
jgi:tetratricopeptide (TPR) repeat protein